MKFSINYMKFFFSPLIEELSALKSNLVSIVEPDKKYATSAKSRLQRKFQESFETTPGKKESLVLLDDFTIPQWLLVNSIAAHFKAQQDNANIEIFSFRRLKPAALNTFKAFNLTRSKVLTVSPVDWLKVFRTFLSHYEDTRDPEALFNLRIENVQLGIDIYESILREGNHTVIPNTLVASRKLYLGLKQLASMKRLFTDNRVAAMFLSHDNYLGPGLAARIGYSYKVPVYLINPKEILRPTRDFEIYERFSLYKSYFNSLDQNFREELLKQADHALYLRLNGETGINLPYQIESAFQLTEVERQLPTQGSAVRVLIAVHDFFDNPHAYSKMMFRDFWVWLQYLGKISLQTDYIWCIKMHRDFSEAERNSVNLFLSEYPNIIHIDPQTSFHQLVAEGVTHVLTCHGTVGHELPAMGVNVINCAHNPHIAYSFTETYLNLKDYHERLTNLKQTDKPTGTEEIREFYAVHYLYMNSSSYIFPVQNEYLELDGISSDLDKSLVWPLSNFEFIKNRTILKFSEALESRRTFSQESILPEEHQRKSELNVTLSSLDVRHD